MNKWKKKKKSIKLNMLAKPSENIREIKSPVAISPCLHGLCCTHFEFSKSLTDLETSGLLLFPIQRKPDIDLQLNAKNFCQSMGRVGLRILTEMRKNKTWVLLNTCI